MKELLRSIKIASENGVIGYAQCGVPLIFPDRVRLPRNPCERPFRGDLSSTW